MSKRRPEPDIPDYIKVIPKAAGLVISGLIVIVAGVMFFTEEGIREDPRHLGVGEVILGTAICIGGLFLIGLGAELVRVSYRRSHGKGPSKKDKRREAKS